MTRRIALAGWFGSGNLGDEMILHALCEGIRARGAEPVAVSVNPEHTRREHGIPAVANRHPAQWASLLRALRGVDAMVVAGGIIQSETSPWNLPFHASRLFAATAARRPVAAAGIGVGQVTGAAGRTLVRRTMRTLEHLVVRDVDSAERLRSWGVSNVAVGADPVAALGVGAVVAEDTMCVILRPPNRRGWRTYAGKASRATDSWPHGVDMAARALDATAAATGLMPRLMAFEAAFDEPLLRAVAARMTSPVEVSTPQLGTVLSEVGRSRLVVTMRYHGAMAALLHERPAVLLDYSPKMASIAAEAGGWAPLVQPAQLTEDRLVRAASSAFEAVERASAALTALRTRLAVNDAALDALVEGPR